MKECDRINGLFGEFHDRHVDAGTEKLMRDHFLFCTSCREDFKWYGFTVQALARLEEISPPQDFVAQLNKRLDGTGRSSFAPFLVFLRSFFAASPYLPLPVGVATLAVIAVVGFVVYNHPASEVVLTETVLQAHQRPVAEAMVAAGDAKVTKPLEVPLKQPLYSIPSVPFALPPSANVSEKLAALPKSLPSSMVAGSRPFVTVVERIGGDNLTVESPSVDQAVESVKKILPTIEGKLVEEKTPGQLGDKILGILIPTDAFSDLTSELINHGAVAVGLGPQTNAPAPSKSGPNNVVLYIHFVQSRE
jgi:hypothetical protein